MTKIYDLIYLNNYIYAVDKEALITENNFYYSVLFDKISVSVRENRNKDCYKIIASTDTTLNLPLLPEIEEDIDTISLEEAKKIFKNKINREPVFEKDNDLLIVSSLQEGYKAASAKKYTEEDLRKAILQFAEDCDSDENLICYNGHDTKGIRQYNDANKWLDDYIKVLTPKPISVELEMVEHHFGMDKEGAILLVPSIWLPKVNENNKVIVIN